IPLREDDDQADNDNESDEKKNRIGLSTGFSIQKILTPLTAIFSRLPISLPTQLPGGKILFIVPILLIGIALAVYSYFFLIRATVTLAMEPQVVSETEAITINAGSG